MQIVTHRLWAVRRLPSDVTVQGWAVSEPWGNTNVLDIWPDQWLAWMGEELRTPGKQLFWTLGQTSG